MVAPKGRPLTFTGPSSSARVFVDSTAAKEPKTIQFDRKEKDKAYLLTLPNSDGSEPIILKNLAGGFVQVQFINCLVTSVRDITPNDDNIDDILQSMVIRSWTIQGGPSSPSEVDSLYDIAADHANRLMSFEGYQKLFGYKLSFQFMEDIQNWNFDYLTNTGLDISGIINETDVLIRQFNAGINHVDYKTNSIVTENWSIVVDKITIQNTLQYP
jgi:hypothetical protein